MNTPDEPWYAKSTSGGQSLIASEATGRSVAVAYDESDGPLLAAAPDLLEALEAVLEGQIGGKPDMNAERFRMARAAIAKARGEEG